MSFTSQIPYKKNNFQKIIEFYLFECPVRTYKKTKIENTNETKKRVKPKYKYEYVQVSQRGLSFQKRGLSGPVLNSLRAAMKRAVPGIILSSVNVDPVIPDLDEYIIIRENKNKITITEGFFYCIRNAFAHGAFNVEGTYYYFENRNGKNKLNGIARLK